MKRIIIIIGILTSFSVHAQPVGNWKMVDSIRFSHGGIHGFKCADSLNCMYLVNLKGSGGHLIRRSTDGGLSWKEVYKDSAYFKSLTDYHFVPVLRNIQYPNTKLCIAVGDSGLILRSTDKGETWQVSRLDTFLLLYSIRFYDENIGLMFTYQRNTGDFPLYSTTDGGVNWKIFDYDFTKEKFYFSSLQFISKNLFGGGAEKKGVPYYYLYFVYNNDMTTIDTIPYKPYPNSLSFSGKDSCWLAGGKDIDTTSRERWTQEIYRTTDGGYTWETQRDTVQNSLPLNDIKFYDHQFGMATGDKALILITDDGGVNWKEELITNPFIDGSNRTVDHIQIPSRNSAFVLYKYQYIYKWTRPQTSVYEFDIKYEISPNPATEYIVISFPPPERWSGGVAPVVRVYDVLGAELMTNSIQPMARSHRLNIERLPPGVYFVRIGDKEQMFLKL